MNIFHEKTARPGKKYTEEEISTALQKTKPATVPGYDYIHVEFLKNLGPKARTSLSSHLAVQILLQNHG